MSMMAHRQRLALASTVVPVCWSLDGLPGRAAASITRRAANDRPVAADRRPKQTWIDRIADQYKAIHDFSATVDMVPALGSAEKSKITEYKDVRGYILFRKPADIRIIGLYPVVRNKAFDMVSNGTDFRLYLPAKNRFITGRNDIAAALHQQDRESAAATFPGGAAGAARASRTRKPALLNLTDEDNAVYILALIRIAPDGDLHVTRSRLVRSHQSAHGAATDLRRGGQHPDRCPLQRLADLRWRAVSQADRASTARSDEYAVVMTVVKMDINNGVTRRQVRAGAARRNASLQVLGEKAQPAGASLRRHPSRPRKEEEDVTV